MKEISLSHRALQGAAFAILETHGYTTGSKPADGELAGTIFTILNP